MSKWIGTGCGKAINGNEEKPDWNCGEFMEQDYDYENHRELGQYYYCEKCLNKFKEK